MPSVPGWGGTAGNITVPLTAVARLRVNSSPVTCSPASTVTVWLAGK